MSHHTRAAVLFCTLTLVTSVALGQWIKTNGPYGGRISALTARGDTVFAATYTGVFRSTDGGRFWTSADSGLTDHRVWSVGLHGGKLFAGVNYHIYRSTDYGSHWTTVHTSPWSDLVLTRFRGFASMDSLDFACTSGSYEGRQNGGVWRSSDGGNSWRLILGAGGISWSENIHGLCVWDTLLFAAGYFNLHYSTDGGLTWTTRGQPTNQEYSWAIAALAGGDSGRPALFLASSSDHVYRSMDLGQSWSLVGANRGSRLATSGGTLYAGTKAGVISRTTDLGTTWLQEDATTSTQSVLFGVATEDADSLPLLYAGRAYRLIRSTDNGRTWEQADSGLTAFPIRALAVQDTVILVGTETGLLRSSDRGRSWSEADYSKPLIECIAIKDSIALAGGDSQIFRSTDYGAHWNVAAAFWMISALGVTDSTWIGVSSVAARSTDGITWVGTVHFYNLAYCVATDGSRVYVGTDTGGEGLFISTDHGRTWSQNRIGRYIIQAVAAQGSHIFVVAYLGDGIFRSTDAGLTWTEASSGLPPPQTYNTLAAAYGTFFYGDQQGGVFRWDEEKQKWFDMSDGLTAYGVRYLSADKEMLYAGMLNGSIWYRPLSEITAVSETKRPLPEKYALFQNYPNPFNPSTLIRYQLPVTSGVQLVVYNLLGQKVAELVNCDVDAGYHEAEFTATGLASGVYFYRMQAGSFVQTRKLLLLR